MRAHEGHSLPGENRGGIGDDTEKDRPTKAHSPSGDGRGKDLSGHGKKSTDRGALTNWRRQREGIVRTRKEIDQPRRTHILETEEGGNCQDTKRNRPTEAHSHSGDGRGRDLSGHGKKSIDRGALTPWRRQREGLVRTRKGIDRPRHTHKLETAEAGTCQDTETNRPTKAHSQTGDGRGRDLSGHGKKSTDRGARTSWRRQREGLIRTERNRPTEAHSQPGDGRGRDLLGRKDTDRPRRTHILETAEGGTCQDTERSRPTEAHSHPEDGREGLVRTQKETDRPRDTHKLETAERGTYQDT